VINDDLAKDWKLDYNEPAGLAILYRRAGGVLTAEDKMFDQLRESLANEEEKGLIKQLHQQWNNVDQGPDTHISVLDYEQFYEAFLGRYYQHFHTKACQTALRCLDADKSGGISWEEFRLCAEMMLFQMMEPPPDIEHLIDELFEKYLLPLVKAHGGIHSDLNPDYGCGSNQNKISKTGEWTEPDEQSAVAKAPNPNPDELSTPNLDELDTVAKALEDRTSWTELEAMGLKAAARARGWNKSNWKARLVN
jgi:hypothetical protein